MAGKRIRELPLRDTFDGTCFLPSEPIPEDDTDITNRVSAEQISGFSNLNPFTGHVRNAAIKAEVSAGWLTFDLVQSDGESIPVEGLDSKQIEVIFRSIFQNSGGRYRTIFADEFSITIPSGATLGYANGDDAKVYVYLFVAATGEAGMAVSSQFFSPDVLQTISAVSTSSDDDALYSASYAGSNVVLVCLGYAQVSSIATAGYWTAPDIVFSREIQSVAPPAQSNDLVRTPYATSGTTAGEDIAAVTNTSAARTITLATADCIDGKVIHVKDESGGAFTNAITIDTEGSQDIDGDDSVQITENYGAITLYSNGSNWFSL